MISITKESDNYHGLHDEGFKNMTSSPSFLVCYAGAGTITKYAGGQRKRQKLLIIN